MFNVLALLENLDQNGDGFASKNEVENFGLVWNADYDLNCKCILVPFALIILSLSCTYILS